jgi:hypothetical protein
MLTVQFNLIINFMFLEVDSMEEMKQVFSKVAKFMILINKNGNHYLN